MDFHTHRIVAARKQHRCEHCGKPIEVGEKHRRSAQVWDGDFSSYREHIECFAAWNELNFSRHLKDRDPCEGAPFLRDDDDFYPEDRQWMREVYPAVAARLGWSAP